MRIGTRAMLWLVGSCGLLAAGPPAWSDGLDDGLVAHWPLDGDAVDRSGHENLGTVLGPLPAAGRVGQALLFDGVDDEVLVATQSALANVTAGPHSYSAWVMLTRPMQPYPWAAFVIDGLQPGATGDQGDQRGLRFAETSAPCFKWVTTAGSYFLFATTEIPLAEWHHIAGTFDGHTGRVYVDGVLSNQRDSVGDPTAAGVWKIGNISGGGTGLGYFPGRIDDVRVYSRALGESEVAELARALRADAGTPHSANEGAPDAPLDGSGSLGDGLAYQWRQIGEPTVDMADPAAARTTFAAPWVDANTTLTFELTVTDAWGQTATDTVDVTIVDVNDPPVAEAGPAFSIKPGRTAALDASLSYDPNSDQLTYAWEQVSGPAVSLVNPTAVRPSFVVPNAVGQALSFRLTVFDGREAGTDLLAVTIVRNAAPVAAAGEDQTVGEGTPVVLDGRLSVDPDGDALGYQWVQVSGPDVALSGNASPTATFVAPLVAHGGGRLAFQLAVSDTDSVDPLTSAPDEVVVSVLNVNDPPRCDLARPSRPLLWPPNHGMVSVGVDGIADPDDPPGRLTIDVTGVTQDEPVDGVGSGDTSPDAVVPGGPSALVRAERSGAGNGRVYWISFTASDGREGCSGHVAVGVPHSAKSVPVDDGQRFVSTEP